MVGQRPHFVCFGCRRGVKQPGSSDSDPATPPRPQSCPECKEPMRWLGRYFKVPPRMATRQWLKVELLIAFGARFWWESRPNGFAARCKSLGSAIRHLIDTGHGEEEIRDRLAAIRRLRRQA